IAASMSSTFVSSSFQVGAHALTGGVMSAAQGGNFWSGALAGGISSGISTGAGRLLKNAGKVWKAVGIVGSGSVSGGIGSVLGGGNFWDGVRQGAITTGLNHLAHGFQESWKTKMAIRLAKKYYKNLNKIIAYSIAAESLLEITDFGDFLSNIRNGFFETYSNQMDRNINEVYDNLINIARNVKSSMGAAGEISDIYIYKTAAAFALKATSLGIENSSYVPLIKQLDMNVHINYRINPMDPSIPTGGGFSGGGSGGSYYQH